MLTSAEFGDAYLRLGWASRYIYDLVRAYTVVLVGYQADDPPMRYLLETLEADRERYPDLQRAYAFASCEPCFEDFRAVKRASSAMIVELEAVERDTVAARHLAGLIARVALVLTYLVALAGE